MATANEPKKDTIYIDVDDEITAIIEKLRNSQQRIVALVLPKRATVLQSIVNMKLLKRTAEKSKKNIVLITSEAGLLPLAGAVGIHVASSLQSRPEIPPAPGGAAAAEPDNTEEATPDGPAPADDATQDDNAESDDFDPDVAADKPVGVLASKYTEPETIQLDNEDAPAAGAAAGVGAVGGAAAAKAAKKGKNSKLKVPNFNKFRTLLILGIVAVILLIGGMVWANTTLPKAEVSLKTNSTDVDTKETIIIDPKATEFEPASNVIPAKIISKQQTGSQQVSTSGQKNTGTKATGEVKFINCDGGEDLTIPAGTGISSGGNTFITQEAVSISLESNTCKDTPLTADTVEVTAISPGAKFNIAATDFSIAGYSSSAVKASSSEAFSGGTDNIVKVVAQADIDSAKNKISSADNSSVKSDLEKQLKAAGYTPVTSTLHSGDPKVTSSANVGDQADTVTVTQVTTYTMYGVKEADVKKVVRANVNKEIDTTKQQILNDGVKSARYQVTSTASSGPVQATLTATSLAGPDIDTENLKKQFAGKKSGDIQAITSTIPGVSDVTVKYSPFWVKAVPKKTDKITIVIVKADGGTTSTQASEDE